MESEMKEAGIKTTQAAKPKALDNIHSQIMELHNNAVDMGLHLGQFNDRVQGCIPRNVEEKADEPSDNELAKIQFAINCLRGSISDINTEINRLNEI